MSFDIPLPLEGDPDGIAMWARHYNSVAEKINQAADYLRDLTNDDAFVSLAVDEIREKAHEARAATQSIAVRYDGAADAFATYSVELAAAQAKARRAIAAMHNANAPARAAETARDDLEDKVRADQGQTPDLLHQFLQAKRQAESFVQHAAVALAEYASAVDDKNHAVEKAKRSLVVTAEQSGLNDNFFEAIQGEFQQAYEWAQVYLAPALKHLHDVLGEISQWVSVVAGVLTVLSVFLPALAPLAAAVSAVALTIVVVMLVCSLALLVLGKGSVGAVLGDAISVVTSKFGGKLAGGITETVAARTGSAGISAVASSSNTLLNPTLASQAAYLFKSGGPTALQGVEVSSEHLVDRAGEALGDAASEAKSGFFEFPGWDLAPSAGGADWNAPPTIRVPAVFSGDEAVKAVVATHVESALTSLTVSAGAS